MHLHLLIYTKAASSPHLTVSLCIRLHLIQSSDIHSTLQCESSTSTSINIYINIYQHHNITTFTSTSNHYCIYIYNTMLSTSQKLLHRAKSLRRLHCSKASAADEIPAMPPTPTSASFAMPMPPTTDRPRTHYGGSSSASTASTASDDELALDAFHFRQASTCSHASRASSSWSSTTSTTSSTSSNSKIQWDSLRLHPPPMPRTPRYDAGRALYYEDASFDFGFDKECKEYREDYEDHHSAAGIHLVSSDEDAQVFQGLSPPPPRHHQLRAHQSAANLSQTAEPAAEAASPVIPRVQQSDDSESDRYFKRGDWKRRGIIFSGYDHIV